MLAFAPFIYTRTHTYGFFSSKSCNQHPHTYLYIFSSVNASAPPKKRVHLYWTGTWMCIVHCKVLLVYREQDSGCTFFPIANVGAGWSSFALWFIAVKSPWLALYVCAVRCISMLVGVPQTTGGELRAHTLTHLNWLPAKQSFTYKSTFNPNPCT